MKSWLWTVILATATTLPALSGIARAQGTDHAPCTNATLKGDYAFSVVDNDSPPLVAVGIGTFDGKGGFSQIDYRGDSLGLDPTATDFVGNETGTYAVSRNCTGSQVVDLRVVVVENRFVISDGGRAIHAVVARAKLPNGTVVHGQTRVEFWKVAPEN